MNKHNDLPPAPGGSALDGIVRAVGAAYARIELDQRAFLDSAAASGKALVCPAGCGACCRPFVPDILPAEATYAATWLLAKKPELARRVAAWTAAEGPIAPPCPFQEETAEGESCSIYPARFLICRLFAMSGVSDKEGRPSFRLCAHMPVAGFPPPGMDRPQLVGEELARAFGAEPPIMSAYAAEILAIDPSEAGERRSVVEALPAALARVSLALSLAEEARDRPYFGHDEPDEPKKQAAT
jgi:uncharacterized protein